MGGIITPSKEEEIFKLLRLDNSKKLQEFLNDNQLPPDALYSNKKRTLLQLSCYYDSPKCLSKLIEMNYDYNLAESNGNTPLFTCCKFNSLSLVIILLSKEDCKLLVKNDEGLNEFDIAFLKGNYQICHYLLYGYKSEKNENNENNKDNDKESEDIDSYANLKINKIKKKNDYDINQVYQHYFFNNNFEYDEFLQLQESNKYPLFNMPLFFRCLCEKIPPDKCPSFAPERKKTKDLQTKIPDPNETWGHFFKRLANMELYNPPLVDKKNVSQMNSLYMNAQMKLIENEYGIKQQYYNQNIDNDEENQPILSIKKKKKKEKKIEVEDEDERDENHNIEIFENKKINVIGKYNENNIINDEKDVHNDDLCVIKVKDCSSDREIKEVKTEE